MRSDISGGGSGRTPSYQGPTWVTVQPTHRAGCSVRFLRPQPRPSPSLVPTLLRRPCQPPSPPPTLAVPWVASGC